MHKARGLLLFLTFIICSCTTLFDAVNKEPKNCSLAVKQIEKLDERIHNFININRDKRLKDRVNSKMLYAETVFPDCLGVYVYKSKKLFKRLPYSDSLISETNNYLKRGLECHPNSSELNFMMGYYYNLIDSVDKAIYYYRNSSELGYSVNKVDSILLKIGKNKDAFNKFQNNNDSSYIFEIYQIPSPESNRKVKNNHYKVYGNKRFEVGAYIGDEYIRTNHILPDSIFILVTEMLKQINFFGLGAYEKHNYEVDYEYAHQWHLPSYLLSFSNPEITHDIYVYGLGTIYGKDVLNGLSSITHMSELNKPKDSIVMKKLSQLQSILNIISEDNHRSDKRLNKKTDSN